MATNELDPRSSPTRPGSGNTDGPKSVVGADGTDGSSLTSAFTTGAIGPAGPQVGMAQGQRDDGPADSTHPAAESVKEQANALWDDAKEAARSKLSEQKDVAADGLGEVAGALRDAAERQRSDASRRPIAQLTGSAADGLERLSSTLRSKDVGSIARDVSEFARNQPVAFFGLALAAGFLAARFLKASND